MKKAAKTLYNYLLILAVSAIPAETAKINR